jgi:putative peptidoglycan lipid II flippase
MTLPATKASSVGHSSIVMASGTAVSRGLGLVRNILLVAVVGGATGPIADAFDIANKIPNILFAVIAGGMLNAVIVPQVVRAYRSPDGQEYLDKLLTLAGTVLLVITGVCTLGASVAVGLYTNSSWTSAQIALAVSFAFWCIPQLFFYGLYTLLGQVLNARGQFGPFMWAPVVNNIISIIGLSVFLLVFGRVLLVDPATGDGLPTDVVVDSWSTAQVTVLGAVTTLGVVGQALILLVPLWRSGFRWRPRFGFRGAGLGSVGRVGLWTFAAVLLDQVAVLVTSIITSGAPLAASDGIDQAAVAGNGAYSQALMIYLLPHSLITVSIATALFTGMSAAAAAGDVAKVREIVSRGLRVIGVFTIFATAVFIVLSRPVVKIIVPTLNAESVVAVGNVLAAMSLGLAPLGAMVLMKWVYFAFEDGRTVFLIQIPVTIVLVVGAGAVWLLAPGQWWAVGAALAMSLSNLVAVLLRVRGMRDRLEGLDLARIVRLHVQLVVSAGIAALTGWLVLHVWGFSPGDTWLHAVWVTLLVLTTMTSAYVLALRIMGVQELTSLAAPFRRFLPRRFST